MTCTHVLGLIDAGPFVDYPRGHLDAAWQHARECATCGPALKAATALNTDLATLPQPTWPRDLAPAVLARIAQIEQLRSVQASAAIRERSAAATTREWSAFAPALGGVAAALAIVLSMPPGGMPFDSPMLNVDMMRAGLVALPWTTTGALVLATGLGLYVAGLFAPLGGRRRG
jgi:hypothetical protein